MKLFFGFDIIQETNGRYGARIVATDPAGNAIGRPVLIVDAIYQCPFEVADVLVSGFRGLNRNRIVGFDQDELKIKNWVPALDGAMNTAKR